MKYHTLIALLTFALGYAPMVNAQDFETSASKFTADVNENDEGGTLNQLATLSEQEPMKGYIEQCTQEATDPDNRAEILKCAWDDKATDEDKAAIYKLLESNPGDKDSNKYSPGLSNFKKEKSSASKVLEKYLMKKLEEALYSDDDSGRTLKVANDHTDFYRIYQSQLGKSLITELSNFCIYTDEKGKLPNIPNDSDNESDTAKARAEAKATLLENKKNNLANLAKVNDQGTESLSYQGYSKCIVSIGQFCEDGVSINLPGENIIQPCELNRMMTAVKNSLATTEDLIETFEERPQGSLFKLDGVDKDGKRGLMANTKRVNINEVTNMGSKELLKDSGYEDELNKIAQNLEKNCQGVENPENDANCKDYLTKKSDNDKMLLEYDLRNRALASKVADELEQDSSEEKLKSILKEQGLSDEEYEKLKAKMAEEVDPNSSDCSTIEQCIKTKIVKRYDNERKQLVKSLENRLKQTQYDDADPQNSNGKDTIEKLTTKYKNTAVDLAKVYQYSNIVSSFIEVSNGNSSGRNTAALAAELESNYFDPNSNTRATASQTGGPTVTPVNLSPLSDLGAESSNKEGEAVNLEASQINEIQGWTLKETPQQAQ